MKEKLLTGLKWFYKSFIWLFIVLLALDIATKQIIMNSGVTPPGLVADWKFVHISYVLNPNAAFGLGANDPNVSRIVYLVVASLITLGVVFYLIYKRKTTKLYVRACLVLVVTGAIGNMIDRIFYSSTNYCVVDWIDFYWFWQFNFNIADCCVVIAAFMLAIYVIVQEVKDYKSKPKVKVVQTKVLSKTERREKRRNRIGKYMKYIVSFKENGERLDKAVALLNNELSRSFITKLLKDGKILVNGKVEKPSFKVKENDEIFLEEIEDVKADIKEEDIPLDVVYEDDDILIINKPQGMVVHPANGHYSGTLVNALMFQEDSLSSINGVIRPGIVHRIDKDTSGLLCVAKNDNAHHFLAEQLKDHTMAREYMALVRGVIKENSGTVEMPIGRDKKDRQKMAVTKEGKPAITHFVVVKRFKDHTLVKCQLVSGRTHQIRVHMSAIGYPVEGDPLYAGKNFDKLYKNGQLLVAYKLKLIHPTTKKEMVFNIDLPDYFQKVLESLR